MNEDSQKINESQEDAVADQDQKDNLKANVENKNEKPLEDKLAETEDKLLRSLAEIENQRRRFEKEIKEKSSKEKSSG